MKRDLVGSLVRHALVIALSAAYPSFAAAQAAGRPCMIDDWHANCFYDAAGDLSYWIFVMQNPIPGSAGKTAITGFAEVKKRQDSYKSWPANRADIICRDWNNQQSLIDDYLSVYLREKFKEKTPINWISPFVPQGTRRCDDFELRGAITKLFPWASDDVYPEGNVFPPTNVYSTHGELNISTLRIPLYYASSGLVWRWTDFWRDCWKATPEGRSFSGCQADFGGFLASGTSAMSSAASKSYPTEALASRARAIAQVIAAAQRFHEATLVLMPHTRKWMVNGAEGYHLEPDDLPPGMLDTVEAANRELTYALDASKNR